MKKSITTLLAIMISLCSINASTTVAIDPKATSINGIVKKCAVEENPKSEIDRYQAA